MLTKGFKDEHQRRITEALGKILELEFVPEHANITIDTQLKDLVGISITELEHTSIKDVLNLLKDQDLSFENYELLGDVILKKASVTEESIVQRNLAMHSLAIYQYAQDKNGLFSFGIIQKINTAKSLI